MATITGVLIAYMQIFWYNSIMNYSPKSQQKSMIATSLKDWECWRCEEGGIKSNGWTQVWVLGMCGECWNNRVVLCKYFSTKSKDFKIEASTKENGQVLINEW